MPTAPDNAVRFESLEEKTSIDKVPPAEPVVETSDGQEGERDDSSPVNLVEKREDGTDYPSGLKLTLIVLALCLAVFLMALDNSIITTAIPKITDQFDSLNDVGWYGSAYMLTTASLQLLFGKFYSYFSIKWVFLLSIALFELGSLICGVARNSVTLIIGRAVAGMGSAAIFSGALIILAHSVSLERRPMFSGFIGSMYGIASVAGPLLGGAFTERLTWRWCFYINLPIGAVTLVVIAIFFPDPVRKIESEPWSKRVRRFDPVGTLVFMPAIICLLLALQWGGSTIYYLPIWFQAVKGASPVRSGIMNLPLLISNVVAAIISGVAVTMIGYYTPFMLLSSTLTAISYGLMTLFKPDTPQPTWIGYQILTGFGIGFGVQQPLIAVQVVLDTVDIPTGTALMVFMQVIGGSIFVSVDENVFDNKIVGNLVKDAPSVNPEVVLNAGATGLRKVIDSADLPGVLMAYSDAITQTFVVGAAIAAVSIIGALIVEWKTVKGKNIGM
ncbi:hypothetical protein UA08_05245 [Talaromyces atroroseus]|uniref:Major facilitator superfamily (MFS) profile domain-containing protein n=1 Tax=Talaromyces atroroseus TaxID=1441469 RepID=A0A225AJN4_TALAT|nr:hypothetical protein UA08_05245 [Talaromyces atroroseus]OKL59583.1 hypothetical protein UA08_05245 [Talaromyces atroroseus]